MERLACDRLVGACGGGGSGGGALRVLDRLIRSGHPDGSCTLEYIYKQLYHLVYYLFAPNTTFGKHPHYTTHNTRRKHGTILLRLIPIDLLKDSWISHPSLKSNMVQLSYTNIDNILIKSIQYFL